jgi:hypothetical protein
MSLLETCFDIVHRQPLHSSLLRKLLLSGLKIDLCSSNPWHPRLLETLMLAKPPKREPSVDL